jgi:hypothetical protein
MSRAKRPDTLDLNGNFKIPQKFETIRRDEKGNIPSYPE